MELLHCDARHARWFQIGHLFILPPCICFHPILFFLKEIKRTMKVLINLRTKQRSLLMHKRRMPMKH